MPMPLIFELHFRLGLYRDAEAQFKSALKHFSTIDMFLYLCKVYVKLDQPMNALDYFQKVERERKRERERERERVSNSSTHTSTGIGKVQE